ncbi:MAG: hypothetical protein DRO36_04170 [Candidatus Hecatellales archaeon]|nr:MAG: hypothetical protein DRO36_04170 [Candidatus Hecatellales archaeon]
MTWFQSHGEKHKVGYTKIFLVAGLDGEVKLNWKKMFFLLFVGLTLLALFILKTSDLRLVLGYVLSAQKTFYCLAFILLFFAVIFYTGSWYVMVRGLGLSFNFALIVTWSSIFFNTITPTASFGGEAVRIYFVNRKTGFDYGTITATVFLHRVVCTIPFLVGSIVGIVYLTKFFNASTFLSKLLTLLLTFIFLSLTVILVLCVKPEIASKLTLKLTNLLNKKHSTPLKSLAEKFRNMILSFEKNLKVLVCRGKIFAVSIALAFLSWFSDVVIAYLIFLSLKYPLNLPAIILVYTVGMTIQMIPIGIPGMVGVVESVMASLYTVIGVPLSLSIAATLMIRAVMFWFQVFMGGVSTILLQKTL